MGKLTLRNVEVILEKHNLTPEIFYDFGSYFANTYDDSDVVDWDDEESIDSETQRLKKIIQENFGEVKIASSFGGYEGGGDTHIIVFHFVNHNLFLRIELAHSSYESTDWSSYNFEEVFPIDIMTTYYKTIEELKEYEANKQ